MGYTEIATFLEYVVIVSVCLAGVLAILLTQLPRKWLLKDAAIRFVGIYPNAVIPYRLMRRSGRLMFVVFWLSMSAFIGALVVYALIFGIERTLETF